MADFRGFQNVLNRQLPTVKTIHYGISACCHNAICEILVISQFKRLIGDLNIPRLPLADPSARSIRVLGKKLEKVLTIARWSRSVLKGPTKSVCG